MHGLVVSYSHVPYPESLFSVIFRIINAYMDCETISAAPWIVYMATFAATSQTLLQRQGYVATITMYLPSNMDHEWHHVVFQKNHSSVYSIILVVSFCVSILVAPPSLKRQGKSQQILPNSCPNHHRFFSMFDSWQKAFRIIRL